MPDGIAFAQNCTSAIYEVCQRASASGALGSGRRMAREGQNKKERLTPKVSMTA